MFTIFIPNVYFHIAKSEREQLFLSCLFVCLFLLWKKGRGRRKKKKKKVVSINNSNCYHNKNLVNTHKSCDNFWKYGNPRAALTYVTISYPKLEMAELCQNEQQLNSFFRNRQVSPPSAFTMHDYFLKLLLPTLLL